MNWKDIGKKLAAIGLPLLGGAVAGPGGALVGKGLAAVLDLTPDAPPEQVAERLANVSGEQLLAIRALEADLAKAQMAADGASDANQTGLIKLDIEKGGVFQSGWRPGSGWVCLVGMAYAFILRPLLPWVLTVCGVTGVPPLPAIDVMELMVLLGGMLGLGHLRSRERMAGKA